MPLRWAAGGVPVYQLVLSMVLTAGAAVALLALASAIYRRALVITGRRVRFGELLRWWRPGG
jgi:ABC-2 type transport system permease protein